MKKLLIIFFILLSATGFAQTLTPVLYPQYISGVGSGDPANNRNVPYACRMTLSGLIPNRVYYYYNRFVSDPNSSDVGVINGQGNIIIPNATAFQRITSPNLSSAANAGSFTTDANGAYTGWFVTEPTASTVYFPGNQLYWRIMLRNDQFAPGGNPTTVELRLTATQPVTVLQWVSYNPYLVAPLFAPQGYVGTLLTRAANTNYAAKNFVMVYDNLGGTGRPIGGTFVEADGSANTTANGYIAPYNSLNEVATRWGVAIPAGPTQVNLPNGSPQSGPGLPNGIRNISQYSLSNGSIVDVCSSATGVYGAINTVDPTGTQGTGAGTLNITACTAVSCNNLSVSAAITGTNCNANTGAINLAVTGGTAPFTYSWSNGASSEDISGLAGGTYTVTVTDASGICTAVSSFTVNTVSLISLSAAVSNANSCGGANNDNGSINLTVNGGVGPYTFTWSNGATTEDLSGLAPGTYTVNVTGAGTCTATATFTITQAAALTISASATPIPNCGGPSTTVTVNASGGVPPYSGTGNFTVTAGTYTYTITDAAGCTASTTVTVAPGTCVNATEVFYPKYIQGVGSGSDFNDLRVPYACRMTISGLNPGATYRYYSRFTDNPASSSNGAGQFILVDPATSTFTRVTSASLSTPGSYGEFTTNGSGSFTGWFVVEPGSDIIYTPGNQLYWRLLLNDGAGGSGVATRVTAANPVSVINWGFTSGAATEGSALYNVANAAWTAKNFVMLYDNIAGTGRPVTGTFIEDEGTSNTTAEFYDTWYEINVNAQANVWGTIIPNNLANGINNISQYSLTNGNFVNKCTSPDGVFGATDTKNTGAGNDAFGTLLVIDCTPTAGCAITTSTTVTNVLCFGASTGAVNLTVTGATAPVTFSWSNGATTEDLTGVPAGTYTVTITDASSCTATATVTVTQPISALSAFAVPANSTCGNANGSINLTVSGGTAPYTYAWSNGALTEDISGLTVGSYNVVVTDANGCTATASETIITIAGPSAAAIATNATCGSSNGSVNLTVTGGTAPYSYAWSNGATTEDLSGVAAGSYSVTVTDANGCTATASATVTNIAGPSAAATATNATCGGSNGSVNLTVTGGTAPYSYAWSNGATTEDLSGVTAGSYSVTVTDANGCTATASATVSNTGGPSVTVTGTTNVLCFGQSTGSINITVTGGTAPYSYAWSNSAITEDLSGLAAGSYSVTVTDANGCTATASATISQPASAVSATAAATSSTCGSSNGSVNLTVTGGTAPYSYAWSNGITIEDLSGLAAGSYSVTVTDANGCTATASATVTNIAGPGAAAIGTASTCGSSNGSVNLTVTGGTAPYSYAWSNGATTEDLSGVAAGSYSVTVTDANGCTATASATVTNIAGPSAAATATNATCGGSNGSVNLTVTGGTAPYSYAWSNGATTEDLSGVTAGSYSVTVTDANGCTATASATVSNTGGPSVTVTGTTNVLCFGQSTGSINITVTGGTAPYSYAWSNSAITEDLSGLAAGSYSVTVTDANGCTATASATISQPASAVSATAAATSSTCGSSNGSVNLTVTGGTAPYSYAWSNGITIEDLSGLAAGSYSVTVTDANGCTATASATVTNIAGPGAAAIGTASTCGSSNGSVNLTVTGGTAPYSYAWSNGATTEDLSGVAAGSYSVTVTDANGCTATASATVTNIAGPSAAATATNATCGGSNGSVNLTVTGGTAPYSYAWSNGATTEDLSGVTAGSYSVTVTDANGCIATASAVVVNTGAPVISTITSLNVLCFGQSTGSINITVTGGTAPYSYFWSNNAVTEDITNIAAGTYTVIVSDANECTVTATVTITQPAAALSATAVGTGLTCATTGNNGTIALTVSGGTAPYTYVWSNGATTQNLSALGAGTYSVTVTDANGCTATASATIVARLAATSSVGTLACNDITGQVTVSVSGGLAPYTVTGTTLGITPVSQNGVSPFVFTVPFGGYSFTVVDAAGCSRTVTGRVAGPLVVSAVAGVIPCGGTSTTVIVTASQGIAPYTGTGSFTVTPGTYTYTVTDARGCSSTSTVTVATPACYTVTEVYYPKYVQGVGSGSPADDVKVPYAARMTIGGLAPGATYRYYSRFVDNPASASSNGVGTYVLVNQAGSFSRVTSASLSASGNYGELTTDGSGSYTGWFVVEPGSDIAFTPGNQLYWRIVLNDGAGGSAAAARITASNPVTVLGFGATPGEGTGLRRTASPDYTAKNFVMLYSNVSGTGRPEAGTFIESDGTVNGTAEGYAPFYEASVDGVNQTWGTIIPNNLSGGINNISQYALTDGSKVNECTSATGVFGGTTDTKNASGGLSELVITACNAPCALSLTTAVVNVSCFGGSTGSVNLTVSGAVGAVTYLWSNGATTEDLSGLAAGTYTVTVTETGNPICTATATVTITQPAAALSAVAVGTGLTCATTGNNGTIALTVSGGTAPYTYVWSNGATTQNLSALGAGTYSVTVTDANGCTATASATIVARLAATSSVGTLACNDITGQVTVSVSGGLAPYTVTGTTLGITPVSQNGVSPFVFTVPFGGYSFTVVDAAGCSRTVTGRVAGPLVVSAVAGVIPCGGTSTTVIVTASQGIAPYTGTGSFTVTPGTYTYTVTDARGCSSTSTVTVATPACYTVTEVYYPKYVQGVGSGSPADDVKVPYAARMTIGGLAPGATYRYYSRFVDNPASASSNGVGTYVLVNQAGSFSRVTSASLSASGNYGELTTDGSGSYTGWFVVEPGSDIAFTPGNQLYWRIVLNDGAGGSAAAARITASNPVTVLGFGATPGEGTGLRRTASPDYTAKNFVMLYSNVSGTGRPEAGTFIESDGTVNGTAEGYAPFYEASVDGVNQTWGTIIPNNLSGGINNISQYALTDGSKVNECTSATGVFGGTTDTKNASGGLSELVITACNAPCALSLTTAVVNVSCFGGSTGSVNLTVSGAVGAVTYLWSNGATTEDLSGLAAGTYTVTVTETGNPICTATATVTITQPASAVSAAATATNATCGGSNGSVNLTVTGGTAPYSYAWSNGATTEDLSGVTAGSYSVTVTDANGCIATASAVVVNTGAPVISTITSLNVLCFGQSTGSINITVTGGTAPYSYFWSNNAVTEDITNIAAGTYTVIVSDANECTVTATVTITQPAAALSATAVGTGLTCATTGNNGTIALTVSGGTAPYTYVWSNGATTQNLSALGAGTYSVTVTDANGCTATASATIVARLAATSSVGTLACNDITGQVTVSVSGGLAPYTVTGTTLGITPVSQNGVSPFVFTVPFGGYSFTVVDAAGCSRTVTGRVAGPLVVSAVAGVIPCGGTSTTVIVTASQGIAPYTGTGSFTVTPGTYTYTVTDARGCSSTSTVTVATPACYTVTEVYYPKYVQGVGSGSPADDVKVPYAARMTIGGLAPGATYRYYSRFVDNPASASSNGVGTYVLVNQAGSFSRVTSASLSASGNYGELTTDGSGSYTGWFVVEPGSDIAFTPGNQLYWRIVLNDGAGGSAAAARITASNPVTVLGFGATPGEGTGLRRTASPDYTAKNFVMLYSNVSGTGRPEAGTFIESDGTVNGTAEGYAPFYEASVDGVNQTWGTIIPNNLSGGINNISQYALTDGSKVNECTSATGVFGGTTDTKNASGGLSELVITACNAPCALSLTTAVVNVSCFGGSTGSVNLTVSGAVGAVTYLWSNGATTEDLSGLAAGTYTVTVTETGNPICTATATVTITQPATALSAVAVGTGLTCATTGNNGTIALTVSGGTAPYTYVWSNGATTQNLSALGAGTYSVTVTDANGCTATASATIVARLAATSSVGTLACNDITGQVTVSVSGGLAPYTVTGTTLGITPVSQNGVSPFVFTVPFGGYSFTVVDAAGCSRTVTGRVAGPLVVSAVAGVIPCGGTSTTVIVTASQGIAPYTGTGSFTVTPGTYTYTVTDARGCSSTSTVTVATPACYTVTEVYYPKYVQGVGSGSPADDVKVPYAARMTIGGLAPGATYRYYSRFVDNPASASSNGVGTYVLVNQAGSFSRVTSASLSASGNYGELTTDGSGSYTGWFVVEPGSDIAFTPGNQLYWRIVLNDGAGGSAAAARITASNPVTVLGFGATPGEGTGLRRTASPDYTAKNFVMLYSNVSGTGRPEAGTFIESDGTVNGTAEGYAPFYEASVDGVNQTWGTIIPNNLSGGINNISQYALTDGSKVNECTSATGVFGGTTDTKNASGGLSELVITACNAPCALSLTTAVVNVSCFGGSTGSVNLTVSGAVGAVTYLWSNGATTEDLSGLAAGTYTVTVTETGNPICTATATVTITQPATALSATAVASPIFCNGGSNIVTVSATGGTAPYTGTGMFTVTAGTYTYTVTDANGCTAVTTITVTQPDVLTATAVSGVIACNGGSTTVTVSASGGTAPYSGTGTFTVTAGTYTYVISDANECTVTTTITVAQPPVLNAVSVAPAIACFGGTSSLVVTATGGTPGYQYSLNGGAYQSGNSFTVGAGSYTVTVKDSRNCTVSSNTVTLTQPVQLTASAAAGTIACFGGTTTLTVTAAGGTGILQYSLNGGAFQAGTIFTVGAGTYTVTVRDANNCTITANAVTVTQPAQLTATASSTPATSGSNGTATVTASGGTSPYTYLWSPGGQTTATATGLAAGTYTVTVTDARGCTTTATTTVTTGCGVIVSAGPDKVLCNGSVTLTASASGGTINSAPLPQVFTEVAGSTGEQRIFSGNIDYLAIGNTFSQAEARTNCNKNATSSKTLTIPAGAIVKKAYLYWSGSGSLDNAVKLNGTTVTADGTKTAFRSGGFSYFAARKDVTSLVSASGTYTVSDLNWSNGSPYCFDNSAYGGWAMTVIYEKATLPSARIHVNTEKFVFTYPAGTYTTTINNISVPANCSADAKLTIVAFEGDAYKGERFRINGVLDADTNNFRGQAGPNLDIITKNAPSVVSGSTSLSYSIETYQSNTIYGQAIEGLFDYVKVLKYNNCPAGGCNGYTYEWKKNGTVVGTTQSIITAATGTYTVKATDCAGCSSTDDVVVTSSTLAASASAGTINCNGGTTSVTVSASGGTAPYTGTGTFTKGAGTWNFTVTDATGCTRVATVTISQPSALSVTAAAPLIPCAGTTTTVTVSAAGGTAPYTGTGIFSRGAGTWTFTVTDSKGCTANATVVIANPVACGPVDPNKCYKLVAHHSGKALTVESGSTANGAQLEQRTYNGGTNQIWKFAQVETGFYSITNVNSNKVADVTGGSTSNDVLIKQWTYNGANWQRWSLTAVSSSYYAIKAKHSNKTMAVDGSSNSNGADVEQRGNGSESNQQWAITEVGCPGVTKLVPVTNGGEELQVTVMPNPSPSDFSLVIKNADKTTPVTVKITDLTGKPLSVHKLAAGQTTVKVGSVSWASGVYMAEIVQGDQRIVVRLVKAN